MPAYHETHDAPHCPTCDCGMRTAPVSGEGQQGEEDAYVIDRLGHLLAEIAVIVNGPEPPLTKWSYHDLPERVRKLAEQQRAGVLYTRGQILDGLAAHYKRQTGEQRETFAAQAAHEAMQAIDAQPQEGAGNG